MREYDIIASKEYYLYDPLLRKVSEEEALIQSYLIDSENPRLVRMIKKGESDTIEFKESFTEDAIQTIGAFANTNGRNVFIGVDQSGKIKGATLLNQHHQPLIVLVNKP